MMGTPCTATWWPFKTALRCILTRIFVSLGFCQMRTIFWLLWKRLWSYAEICWKLAGINLHIFVRKRRSVAIVFSWNVGNGFHENLGIEVHTYQFEDISEYNVWLILILFLCQCVFSFHRKSIWSLDYIWYLVWLGQYIIKRVKLHLNFIKPFAPNLSLVLHFHYFQKSEKIHRVLGGGGVLWNENTCKQFSQQIRIFVSWVIVLR